MNRKLKLGDLIFCKSSSECKQTFRILQKLGFDGVVVENYTIEITKVPEDQEDK